MLTLFQRVKAAYLKACILTVASAGLFVVLGQIFATLAMFAATVLRVEALSRTGAVLTAVGLLCACVFVLGWRRLAWLSDARLLSSWRGNVGAVLLTVAALAFPGSIAVPVAAAYFTDTPELFVLTLYSALGIPVALVSFLGGYPLLRAARTRSLLQD